MITFKSRLGLALGLVLLGGTTMLAGCGSSPTPVSQTTRTRADHDNGAAATNGNDDNHHVAADLTSLI